jgi:hypothetical protein
MYVIILCILDFMKKCWKKVWKFKSNIEYKIFKIHKFMLDISFLTWNIFTTMDENNEIRSIILLKLFSFIKK